MRKEFWKHLLWQTVPLAAVLLGVVCMLCRPAAVGQAVSGLPMILRFEGQCSRDGESWSSLEEAELSARQGDLVLRGRFDQEISPGSRVYYYQDHIGTALYINGQLHSMDFLIEMEQYGLQMQPSLCGRSWQSWYFPEGLSAEDEVTLHLHQPHAKGEEAAYREFLGSLLCGPAETDLLELLLLPYSRPFQAMGILFIIAALMLLGTAAAAGVLRISLGAKACRMGMLTLFMGAFLILDTVDMSLWSERNILNTYGLWLCIILGAYWLGLCTLDALSGKRRRTAEGLVTVSGLFNTVLILLSFAGAVLIYDVRHLWMWGQAAVCLLFLILLGAEVRNGEGKDHALLLSCALLCSTLLLDLAGVARTMYSQGTCTKAAFAVLFVFHFLRTAKRVLTDHQSAARAVKLEKELEESRIAIMLSQIQPHFLYNALGTIRGLCRQDPEEAWKALGDFSGYLRGNMNALTNSRKIPFARELRHIEAYLRLEQLRMGERLRVVYDIRETEFFLPPLSVQPLVENAVKHGVFDKPGGGTVTLQSFREEDRIVIRILDDGVGFDTEVPLRPDEHHARVGISNVRSRLETMSGGSVRIESTPGEGTTVTLRLDGAIACMGGE